MQRQQVLKRLRNAQEIQRRLEELEVEQKDLECRGVELEKMFRGERHGMLFNLFFMISAKYLCTLISKTKKCFYVSSKEFNAIYCHGQ